MKQCILHIGMDKTGSTSIQGSLYRNPSLRGAHYADMGRASASVPIKTLLREDPTELLQLKRRVVDDAQAQALKAQAQQALQTELNNPAQRVLISGEGMSNLGLDAVEQLRDLLAAQGRSARVVAYVRSAKGYMESTLQQRAKTGLKNLNLGPLLPKYRQRFAVYDQVFGRTQVDFWRFQPSTFPQNCVVRDFCARLDLELDPTTIERRNESLSRSAVALMMIYWRQVGDAPGITAKPVVRKLVEVLAKLPGGKCRLSPELVAPLFKERRPQLDWMEERMGVSMSELGNAGPDDVRCEADLLRPDAQALAWLEGRLETSLGANPSEQVLGQAMLQLAERLSRPRPGVAA